MTLTEVKNRLQNTGFPVAYMAFPEQTTPPFIVFLSEGDNNFSADGSVYFSAHKLRIELYTAYRDLETELSVESALSDLFYEKTVIFIDNDQIYETIYELEV